MKDKVDEFLKKMEMSGQEEEKYIIIYKRPSKIKAVLGFIASVLVLIACLLLLLHSFLGILITLGDLVIVVYYGSNLFTENGFGHYEKVRVIEEEDKK